VSRKLIQLGTPCHALVQRRHSQSHRCSTRGGAAVKRNLLPLATRRTIGTLEAARTKRSLRTLRRAWRVRAASNRVPGPKLPRSRRRRHRRIDPVCLRVGDARANRSPSASLLAACHRLGAAVTSGFVRHRQGVAVPDTTRVSGGLIDARTRSGRVDPWHPRKPSLPPGLLVHLHRQTACREGDESCGPVHRRIASELATWRLAPPRLVARGTEPPRVRVASRGMPARMPRLSRGACTKWWLRTATAPFVKLASRRARSLWLPVAPAPKGARLSSGHSGETSTTSQERVFMSFP